MLCCAPRSLVRIALLAMPLVCARPAMTARAAHEHQRGNRQPMPKVGDRLPEVEGYDEAGNPFALRTLRGHHTVLVFGCLTCQKFLENGDAMEALAQDCANLNVKFYYVHKGLVHPGLRDFVEPYTQRERLWYVRLARRELQSGIPWIADNDRRQLQRAFGKAANLEMIVDPQGEIIHVAPFNNPAQLRDLLQDLVGPIEARPSTTPMTRGKDLAELLHQPPVVSLLKKPANLASLVVRPEIDDPEGDFPLKLTVRGERPLLRGNPGQILLQFDLDPLYQAEWAEHGMLRAMITPIAKGRKTIQLERETSAPKGRGAAIELAAAVEAGWLAQGLQVEVRFATVASAGKPIERMQRFSVANDEAE